MSSDPHATTPVIHAGTPLSEARLAVVLLHGRGSSADAILGLADALEIDDAAFFAPEAAAHTWYPLSFMAPRAANEPFLSSALAKVGSVVRAIEAQGLARQHIALAGFSQGACLASEFVARHPARYAALVAFTGGLIGPQGSLDPLPSAQPGPALDGMPALLMSGDPDPHVPWMRVEESAATLRHMGAAVTTQRYPGRPHTVSADEILRARQLLSNLPRK